MAGNRKLDHQLVHTAGDREAAGHFWGKRGSRQHVPGNSTGGAVQES